MAVRVTQVSRRVLVSGIQPNVRVTQDARRVLYAGNPNVLVTQIATEALVTAPSNAVVTQVAVEVLMPSVEAINAQVSTHTVETAYSGNPNAQVSSQRIEAAYTANPTAQITQQAIEVAYNEVPLPNDPPTVGVPDVAGYAGDDIVFEIYATDDDGTVNSIVVTAEDSLGNPVTITYTTSAYGEGGMVALCTLNVPAAGTYTVTGTATDDDGATATDTGTVTVTENPVAEVAQHVAEVAYPTPGGDVQVPQAFAELASQEPSDAHLGQFFADVADHSDGDARAHELYAEIARGHDAQARLGQLAVEVACRTKDLQDDTFPALKRLDLANGQWDGKRRQWEVRLFRRDGQGKWRRLRTPAPEPVNCQFTYLASGGMADAHVSWPVPFTASQHLLDGDRMEVWVKRAGAWEVWYRGTYRNGDGASGRPGSFTADFFGPMELCNHIKVERRYAMPGQDVSALFARLIDDYLDPRRLEAGLPAIQRRLSTIGEEVGTRDFSGTLLDAFNSLAEGVPGISWGVDLTPGKEDEFFLFRQDATGVTYNFALGKDAQSASLGYDSKEIVNSLVLTGAANPDSNLITNGGFEKPTGEAQNILQNPGFEEGDGGYAAHWERTSGEPSRKQSAQDNVNAHSGSWFEELDNMQGTEEITSDFTELCGAVGEIEMYGFRFWYAAEDAAHPIDLEATVHFYDSSEVEQVSEKLTWTVTCSNQRWQEFYRSFPVMGERKFRVSFKTPTGGGSDRGAAVDEVSLYSLKSIRQENWDLVLNGAPDVEVIWDASPAPQRDYYVLLDADTTGADQSVKLRPDQSFSLREHQQVEFSVMLRFWAREGGPASMDVQIGVERWDGSNWQVASGGSDPGIKTVTLAELDPEAWATHSVTAVGVDKTQEARPFVVIPQGQDGVLGVDAAMVLRGSGDTDFQEGEANFTFEIDTSDPAFQADTGLTADQKALLASLIATYGTRERSLNVPELRTRAQAVRYALNYFLQHSEARTPGPVAVYDRLRLVRPDGQVRLSNVPGQIGLKALFPVSVTHRLDRSGWHCEMERDVERPNDPRLWKELKGEIVGVAKVARAGVEQTLSNQQRG